MNLRSRFLIIISILFISTLLIWPNIGERVVKVYFMPGLSAEKIDNTIADIGDFLKKNYKNEYAYEKKKEKISEKDASEESYLQIKGNFVQAAFLNEISRIDGVDGERITLEKMWVEESFMAKPFKLGLDLQGGMNLILEADFKKLQAQIESKYPQSKIDELKDKISKAQKNSEKNSLEAELSIIEYERDFSVERKKDRIRQAREKIRSRIDKTGVSEPLIRIQGEDKIEISLPGVSSPEHAKKIISSTARVEYRLSEPTVGGADFTSKASQYFAEYASLDSESKRELFIKDIKEKIQLPERYDLFVSWEKKVIDTENVLRPAYFMALEKEVALDGDDMVNSYANFSQDRMEYEVTFTLSSDGAKKFADITTKNKGRRMAILIDDKIRSAPTINEPITGGSGVIFGSFTRAEANDLALIIKEGALPVPMNIVEERSVGPSLGKAATESGLTAIMWGLFGVALFMLIYYHVGGLVAVFALALNLLFMSAILALMDFTITLPGLAGVVLTLGMVVDANVIIYERIKEELGRGKNTKLAVEQGFERATWTILDSNLTTMLAAIVLSQFGVGPIKGFAVTLFIGILSSLFTSLYVTKTLFYWLVFDMNIKSLHLGIGKYRKALPVGVKKQTKEAV